MKKLPPPACHGDNLMNKSSIEWTDYTWNPSTGCSKVSPGCKHCYAEELTERFPRNWANGFKFTLHPDRFRQPYTWKKPGRIFVNSMSDLFHEEMPLEVLRKLFGIMADCSRHCFQILTKRHERLACLAPRLHWSSNIWMGVSIENQQYAHRTEYLRKVPAHVRFLSVEPLLGPVKLNLRGIHWVIVGGESGPHARPMDVSCARDVRDQTLEAGVRFFMKQMGGRTHHGTDRPWIPEDLFIRQFPRSIQE
jgi:protein gp37